jgi:uncharacterized membrane protein
MGNTRILPWVVLIGLVVFSAATYADLPAEIPTKISARGIVTHTAPKGLFEWFLLVGIAALTQAFMTGLTVMLPKKPELFNFSEKEKFLRLPKEYQRPVIVHMQFAMDIIGALTMMTLGFVQWMIWRTALGHPPGLSLAWLMGLTVLIAPVAFLLVGRVSAEVDIQERRAREAGRTIA